MTSTIGAMGAATAVLKPYTLELTQPYPDHVNVTIHPDNLLQAVRSLVDDRWGYLTAIIGLDRPAPAAAEGQAQEEGQVEILYVFVNGAAIVNIRFVLPYSKAIVPTISGMLPQATLYEWELQEMFGVEVIGLRITGHLILADDWPEGVYPLRKSFTGFNGKPQTEGAKS